MKNRIYRFFEFMTGCGGNWRNAVFIPCPVCMEKCSVELCGCLLTTEQNGRPRLISVACFEELSGEKLDPAECIGTISRAAFEALYARYLDWEMDDPAKCSICVMCHESLQSRDAQKATKELNTT